MNAFDRLAVAGLFALAVTGAGATPNNLIVDGDFAQGARVGEFREVHEGHKIGRAWTVINASVDLVGSYWQQPPQSYSLDLNGSSPGAIAQDLVLAPGSYRFSFALAGNPTCGDPVKTLHLDLGPVTRTFTFDTTGRSVEDMGWTRHTLRFHVDGETPGSVVFSSGNLDGCGPAVGGVLLLRTGD